MKSYSEKLRDPRWQKKRLQILERDNWTCKYCGDKDTELHIHHYEYNKEPWGVDDCLLITLCKHCHTIAENLKSLGQITILRAFKFKSNNGGTGVCTTYMIFERGATIFTTSMIVHENRNVESLCSIPEKVLIDVVMFIKSLEIDG